MADPEEEVMGDFVKEDSQLVKEVTYASKDVQRRILESLGHGEPCYAAREGIVYQTDRADRYAFRLYDLYHQLSQLPIGAFNERKLELLANNIWEVLSDHGDLPDEATGDVRSLNG